MTETRTAEGSEPAVRCERRLPSPADVAGVGPNLLTARSYRALPLRAARAGGEDASIPHASLVARHALQPAGALRDAGSMDVSSPVTTPAGFGLAGGFLRGRA